MDVDTETGAPRGLTLTLSNWVYEGLIKDRALLTLHPDYFTLSGGVERAIYRIARKHAGEQPSGWTCRIRVLHDKTGSESPLKQFTYLLKRIVTANDLPDYDLKLVEPSREISGRVLGRFAGRYLTYSGIEHAIIVGASRSGKGVGHVVPTLIAWPHSAFVYDRKGELWHITADHRKRFSHVFYFSPTAPNTVRWNPLFEVRKGAMEIADIQNVVGILVDPLGRKAGDLNFWDQSATDFFTALILHVLYS